MNTALILASASPRRQQLLAQIGCEIAGVQPADIDETPQPGEQGRELAGRLSLEKAQKIAAEQLDSLILAADTVVTVGRRILPKTETREEAERCLRLLSGRQHQVWTGIALVVPGTEQPHQRVVCTRVKFKRLHEVELSAYLESNEWHGVAGGYAIQGMAARYIQGMNGSYSNVVGLPLFEVAQVLGGVGYL